MNYTVRSIGWVSSPLVDRESAPKQGFEGAPPSELIFDAEFAGGLADVEPGSEILVLTWLHQADRTVLSVHPRDDLSNPMRGVFSTRSADRPNPIGIHRVRVTLVDGLRVTVQNLEAVDGTPIVDVKPVLPQYFES